MAFYERDSKGNLVPTQEQIPEEAIRLMERYDDESIIHRMTTGIASQEFIYRFPIKTATGTKEVVGIGTDGAFEIAKMLGNLEALPDARVDKDSDPDYMYGMVRVKDIIRNVTFLGVGRACKYQIGKGNLPDHDRLNEHAFVSCISKAQRNGILHQTPEEIIARIVNTFDKGGRSKQLPPRLEVEPEVSTPSAVPSTARLATVVTPEVTPEVTPTETAIAEQQEKLKVLRIQVHNRFQTDLGIGLEKRKAMLMDRFSVDTLTDLNEQQLKDCLSWVEELIQQKTVTPAVQAPLAPAPPPTDTVKELGYESTDEQHRLRGRLYTTLTSPNQLSLKDEEAKEFLAKRGFAKTTEIPKDKLLELIQEANDLVKAKQTPSEF